MSGLGGTVLRLAGAGILAQMRRAAKPILSLLRKCPSRGASCGALIYANVIPDIPCTADDPESRRRKMSNVEISGFARFARAPGMTVNDKRK